MIEDLELIPRKWVSDNRGKSCKIQIQKERSVDEIFLSYSKKNVIRGIHFQEGPYAQVKVVTVLKGKITDVVIDLRPASQTFLLVNEFEISEESEFSLKIPRGCGHGFLAKSEENIVLYEMQGEYNKNFDKGILWKSINYDWNVQDPIISMRDQNLLTLEKYLEGMNVEGCL